MKHQSLPAAKYASSFNQLLLLLSCCFLLLMSNKAAEAQAKPLPPQIALQTAHFGEQLTGALSPDGRTMATAGEDGRIKLWDVDTGQLKRTIFAHNALVTDLAYSIEGRLLASGSGSNGTVKIWNTATGEPEREWSDKAIMRDITALAFAPDGTLVIAGHGPRGNEELLDAKIALWRTDTDAPFLTFDEGSTGAGVLGLAVSPDGKTIVTSSEEMGITIWDGQTGKPRKVLTDYTARVSSVSISLDGRLLASGGDDGDVKIRDLETGSIIRVVRGDPGHTNQIAFTPNSKNLLVSNFDVSLVDVSTGATKQVFDKEILQTKRLYLSRDGRRVGVIGIARGDGVPNQEAHVWEVSSGRFIRRTKGYAMGVNSVALSPDGKLLAVGNFDGLVRLWDPRKGSLLRVLPQGKSVWSVAFAPDNKTLLVGSGELLRSGEARLWDARTGKLKYVLAGHLQAVRGVAFSPDGKMAATACEDGNVRLWDVRSGALQKTFSDNTHSVFSVAFAPEGRTLAAGSFDRKLRLWNTETGALIRTMQGHAGGIYSVAFSSDGKTVAAGMQDRLVDVWNAETGEFKFSLMVSSLRVPSIAFTPDGRSLLAGADDGQVTRWDPNNGTLIGNITTHELGVSSISVTADGTRVLSGSLDNTVRITELHSGRVQALFYSLRVGETSNHIPEGPEVGGTGPGPGLDMEYVVTTPEGYYLGSRRAEKLLRFRTGTDLFQASHFHQTFFKPDVVRRSLANHP